MIGNEVVNDEDYNYIENELKFVLDDVKIYALVNTADGKFPLSDSSYIHLNYSERETYSSYDWPYYEFAMCTRKFFMEKPVQ